MNEPTYIYSSHAAVFQMTGRWENDCNAWMNEILARPGVEYVNHTHTASQSGTYQYIVLITRSMTPGSPYSKGS